MEQNDNKYAPPNARVADPTFERPTIKTKQVGIAIVLIWSAVGLGTLGSEVTALIGHTLSFQDIFESVIKWLIIFCFYLWILNRVSAGKNWPRFYLLITTVLSVVVPTLLKNFNPDLFVRAFPALQNPSLATVTLGWVCFALRAAALWFLFSSPGSDWFSKKSS